MRSVLFINRVYPPAQGATGQLLSELAPALVEAGWDVSVLTSRPPGAARSEVLRGVRVTRVRGLPFASASFFLRALSYLALYPALLWRALRLPPSDVVVTMTDPPLQVILGPILRAWKGSRLVHWAQDLYPELAEEMGLLTRDGWLARRLRALSTRALARNDRIVAIGRCMKERLAQRGLPRDRILVLPNWGHPICASTWGRHENPFRKEQGLEDKFVVMYSGNLGVAHSFEVILEAAERLQTDEPQVVFVFVGNGARLSWVQEQGRRRQLRNVRFVPFQPQEKLAQTLAAADLHLASMRENLCGLVVPSKVYGALAVGRACVFLGPERSETAQLILEHGCGSVLSGSCGSRLAACISYWKHDPARLREAEERAEAIGPRLGLATAAAMFARQLEEATCQTPLGGPLAPASDRVPASESACPQSSIR
jgi:glycosyltransferase involved in cell wall biosynthesis